MFYQRHWMLIQCSTKCTLYVGQTQYVSYIFSNAALDISLFCSIEELIYKSLFQLDTSCKSCKIL